MQTKQENKGMTTLMEGLGALLLLALCIVGISIVLSVISYYGLGELFLGTYFAGSFILMVVLFYRIL